MNDQLSYNKQLFIKQFFSHFHSIFLNCASVGLFSFCTHEHHHTFFYHPSLALYAASFILVRPFVRPQKPTRKREKKKKPSASCFFFFFLIYLEAFHFSSRIDAHDVSFKTTFFLGFVNIFRSFIIIYYSLLLFLFLFFCACAVRKPRTKKQNNQM